MTSRQADLLQFIQAYTRSNGFAPSFEEMRVHLCIGSKSGVDRLVRALEERGEIVRHPNRARAIEITDSAEYQRGRADGEREGYARAMRELGRAAA